MDQPHMTDDVDLSANTTIAAGQATSAPAAEATAMDVQPASVVVLPPIQVPSAAESDPQSSPPQSSPPADASILDGRAANVAADASFDFGDDEDDEPEAPLGTAIGDDEDALDAMMESSEDEEDEGPTRKRRASGNLAISAGDYLDSDDSGGEEHGYDPEEYAAATGKYSTQDLEFQCEQDSGIACGLPSSMMHALESEFMPEFKDYSRTYLEIRNLICRQWQLNLTRFLTFDSFLLRSNLDGSKLRHSAKRIFDFLNTHGFINCGLLPIAHDAKAQRPAEQRILASTETNTPLVRRKSAPIDLTPTSDSLAAPLAPKTENSADVVKQEGASVVFAAVATDANGDVVMKPEGVLIKDEPTAAAALASSSSSPLSSPSPSPFKRVLVIGAGASGLAAARQLQSFGHTVTVLEGRDRVGGRVNTIRDKFSAPVDLGASIMTGLFGSPLSVLSKQMVRGEFDVGFSTMTKFGKATVESPAAPFSNLMHYIQHHCPLYDSNGAPVDKEMDSRMESLWNQLLEAEYALKVNSGHVCEPPAESTLTKDQMESVRIPNPKDVYGMDVDTGLQVCRKLLGVAVTPAEEKLLDWHAANLEYGCATALNKLSLVYWDQDDGMAWEGDHALIKPGFGTFIDHLTTDVDIRRNQHVQSIAYPGESEAATAAAGVRVQTKDNVTGVEQTYEGDYVVCTASLGVLKAGELEFQPSLPAWKTSAIESLGFGLLNKLILEFPTSFWKAKNDQDMFGYVAPGPSKERGKFYIFWNLERSTGRPILAALCAGEAAYSMEESTEATLVTECMIALRAIHSEQTVPDPTLTQQTKWSQDRYARGSYSYVAAGNNGKEYDALAKPVGPSLFFAGEACNRDYPATVPGAYISGLRAAGQLQSRIFGWQNDSPPAEVLRELARQPKTDTRSKADTLASSLTQQAVHELNRLGGRTDEADLKRKMAEILARQRRSRRGFRYEILQVDEGDAAPAFEENIASKLEAAARLLKQGLFAAPRQHVTIQLPNDARYAHIKRHDGAFERPFDARTHDTQGLPSFVSFHEFDVNTFGAPSSASAAPAKKTRRELRHEKKRALSRKHKSSSERASKKQKGSRKSKSKHGHAPEMLIHRHVGKTVLVVSSASFPVARAQPKLLKRVQRKAAAKVLEDWSSKPRGSLAVSEWLNDKRRAKISDLVRKYLDIYSSSSSRARPSEVDLPPAAASAAATNGRGVATAPAAAASSSQAPQQRQPRFQPR